MKHFALLVCGLAMAAGLAGQTSPPDTQVGNFLFKIPAGWDRQEKGDTTLLFAPSTSAGQVTFIALAADETKTDLRTSFNIEWEGFKKQYRILSGGQITPGRLPNGHETFYAGAIASDSNGVRWSVVALAAQLGNRIQTVMFMSNASDPPLGNYVDAFQTFLADLRFTSESPPVNPAPAAPAAAVPSPAPSGNASPLPRGEGKFDGLYRAVGVVSGDPFSARARIGYKFVVFLPDGRFKESIIDEGLDHLDEDAEIRWNPVGWGTYELRGDVGRIVFPPDQYSKEPIIWPFKAYPDRLVVRGDTYTLLDHCNDLRLAGTFRRADYQTTYAARQGITFTPDGKFTDEGVFAAAGVMVRKPGGGYDFDDGAPGSGTYRIANYTIELTYANGRVKRTSFYIEPGTARDNVREFYLNTWKFARVQ